MESLKGDGASDDIAREGFDGSGIGGIEVDISGRMSTASGSAVRPESATAR